MRVESSEIDQTPGHFLSTLNSQLSTLNSQLSTTASHPPEHPLHVHIQQDQPPEEDVAERIHPAAADAAGMEKAILEERVLGGQKRMVSHPPLPILQDADLHPNGTY